MLKTYFFIPFLLLALFTFNSYALELPIVVDIVKYEKDLRKISRLRRGNKVSIINPSFQIKTKDYGNLISHARNCSAFLSTMVVVRCADGWISQGRLENFIQAKVNQKNYDIEEKLYGAPDMVFTRGTFSTWVDPRSYILKIFQLMKIGTQHFYKMGDYNLLEETNRYDPMSIETEKPRLIDGYLSPRAFAAIIKDPYVYHKGEFGSLIIEVLTRKTKLLYYVERVPYDVLKNHKSFDFGWNRDLEKYVVYIIKEDRRVADFYSLHVYEIDRASVIVDRDFKML